MTSASEIDAPVTSRKQGGGSHEGRPPGRIRPSVIPTAAWLVLLCPLAAPLAAQEAPDGSGWTLTAQPTTSSDGVYQLAWNAGAGGADTGAMRVEEARDADFSEPRLLYRGEDHATIVTGRADGDYHYRLRADAAGSGVVARVTVSVRHHPLARALSFFAAGLFVFLATVWLVVRGPEPVSGAAGTEGGRS